MKRSEINLYLQKAVNFLEENNFYLPPFAYWSVDTWKKAGPEANEIRQNCLGWDFTDFGSNNFEKTGLILFTLRNGSLQDANNIKNYCEKIMIADENQRTPMHFHWNKVEDIINRGGGNLVIELYVSEEGGELSQNEFEVSIDGIKKKLKAGEIIILKPGESITLHQGLYHSFYGEQGKGKVLVGEVSEVNDDANDNRFYEKCGRFPEIEEDESPLYLLCNEYPQCV